MPTMTAATMKPGRNPMLAMKSHRRHGRVVQSGDARTADDKSGRPLVVNFLFGERAMINSARPPNQPRRIRKDSGGPMDPYRHRQSKGQRPRVVHRPDANGEGRARCHQPVEVHSRPCQRATGELESSVTSNDSHDDGEQDEPVIVRTVENIAHRGTSRSHVQLERYSSAPPITLSAKVPANGRESGLRRRGAGSRTEGASGDRATVLDAACRKSDSAATRSSASGRAISELVERGDPHVHARQRCSST